MRRRFTLLCLLILGPAVGPLRAQQPDTQQASEETFTLQDSVQRALQNNPTVLGTEGDIQLAKSKIKEANSLLYPKVDYNFNFSKHKNNTTSVLPPDLGLNVLEPPPSNVAPNTVEDLYTSRFGMRQFLFTGGRISSTRKLAKANLKGAQSRLEVAKKDVILSVTTNFYDVILKRQILSAYEKSYDTLEVLLAKAPASGAGRLALEQEASRARLALSNQRQELENARLAFLNAVGLELFKRIEFKGELETKPVEIELDKLLAWAVENRPELQETRTEEEVNQLSVDLSLAQREPTVAFGAGYELRDSDLALRTSNWNATVNLNLPLFDGFSTISRIRQSRDQAELGRVKKTKLQDQVFLDVRQTYQECLHWQDELTTRGKELQRVDQMAASYTLGRVSLAEWLQYHSWRVETHIQRDQAIYEHIVARARLERAVGRPLND
jgi:outer membrane protein